MKKILFFIFLVIVTIQNCKATQIYMNLPTNFPSTLPIPGNYVARSSTHAFFEKWAESIKNNNQEIILKTLEKNYQGIGVWDMNEFHYEPNISLKNNSITDCALYTGTVNKEAYYKLKSPILYDSKNKICVAVIGWRDYSKSQNPYFFEPSSFEQIVYVFGNFPQTATEPFNLKEVVLLPSNIDNKRQEKKYIKDVNRLYNKSVNATTNTNSFLNSLFELLGDVILLPFEVLLGVLGNEI